MKPTDDDAFYVGYLPQAPVATARFMRRVVIVIGVGAMFSGIVLAVLLPYFGAGVFEFGRTTSFSGTLRCEKGSAHLETAEADFLLVGYGKNGIAPEICGAGDRGVAVRGTKIQRDGRKLIEVIDVKDRDVGPVERRASASLGRFTLTGEIVDSKCYFGVMNPGEGRMHRACAELCLRGGIPAVLVARDRSGGVAHLIVSDGDRTDVNSRLLRWVGQPIEVTGEVFRTGRWLRLEPDFGSIRFLH
jgi:hypothetical protein